MIRALIDLQPEARSWFDRVAAGELRPAWPAHFYAEVAHTLVRLVRAGRSEPTRAADTFAAVRRLPTHIAPSRALEAAMAVALDRGLTVYDAAYVVLAEALDAPLVTGDRQLANATEQAVLLPG